MAGTLLGEASMPTTLTPGWSVHALDVPVPVTTGTHAVVSYSTGGDYGFAAGAFLSDRISLDSAVTMPSDVSSIGGNGVYSVTPTSFPNQSPGNSFYGVDFVYELGIGDNTPPVISNVSVAVVGFAATATVAVTDSETLVSAVYRYDWGDGTVTTASVPTSSHTYATSGLKAVLVSVTDAGGLADYFAKPLSILPAPVAAVPRPPETIDLVEPWIYGQLMDDDLLTLLGGVDHVSGTLSVEELPTPYVTFLMQSTRDVQGNAGQIISTDNLYIVKAVAATASWDDVVPIAAILTGLFHLPNRVVNVTGGSLTSTRENIIQYPEITEGVQYRHLGAVYRIRASRDE
jgi:PKD repeat protein